MHDRDDRLESQLQELTQVVADLESLVHESVFALQHEILGARDSLSEELVNQCRDVNRRLAALEHHRRG